MSNNVVDRLAERLNELWDEGLETEAHRRAVAELAALAKQQAHEATAEPAAVPVDDEPPTFTPWDSLPWKPKPIGFARRADIETYAKVFTLKPVDAEHDVAMFTRDQVQRAVSVALMSQDNARDVVHELDITELINQRDYREEIIDSILDHVLGKDRPEWSSSYGFLDAMRDVEESQGSHKNQEGVTPGHKAGFNTCRADDDGWCEWQQPIMRGYLMKCCDCGLVHEAEFDAVQVTGPASAGGWPMELLPNDNYRVQFRMRRALAAQAPQKAEQQASPQAQEEWKAGNTVTIRPTRMEFFGAAPPKAEATQAGVVGVDPIGEQLVIEASGTIILLMMAGMGLSKDEATERSRRLFSDPVTGLHRLSAYAMGLTRKGAPPSPPSAPQAAPTAQAEPSVTDEQIDAAYRRFGTSRPEGFAAAVRAILAEAGIKEKP